MPYYKYEEFRKACHKGKVKVLAFRKVVTDATECFNLKTVRAILDFIANGGLEKLEFVNCKQWENNPDKSNPIMVDSYQFHTMNRLGYIAFFQNAKTDKWIIKSFHLSNQRNLAMELALKKAGLINGRKERR